MNIRKLVTTVVSSVLVVGSVSALSAPVASAEGTWVQSFGRSGPDAPCVEPASLRIEWQESWGGSPKWSPSWEQWANNGNGGWVCTREIVWLPLAEATYPGTGCVLVETRNIFGPRDIYVDFEGSYFLPAESPLWLDSNCTNEVGFGLKTPNPGVYTTGGIAQANFLCSTIFSEAPARIVPKGTPDVFYCGDLD